MKHLLFRLMLLALLGSTSTPSARAQTGGGYDLTWHPSSISGGNSTGGGYALMGTIGQPVAGAMGGGDYTLASGFWVAGVVGYRVYLPQATRD